MVSARRECIVGADRKHRKRVASLSESSVLVSAAWTGRPQSSGSCLRDALLRAAVHAAVVSLIGLALIRRRCNKDIVFADPLRDGPRCVARIFAGAAGAGWQRRVFEEIDLKFAFTGGARLHLVPHANCRLADLPVRKILYGQHLCADLTLPYGRVLHDYLA